MGGRRPSQSSDENRQGQPTCSTYTTPLASIDSPDWIEVNDPHHVFPFA